MNLFKVVKDAQVWTCAVELTGRRQRRRVKRRFVDVVRKRDAEDKD